MRHPKGYWYLPGLIYDLAFKRMFRGLRRRVARTVEKERLYPWLDVCSGTGSQFRTIAGRSGEQMRRAGERGGSEQSIEPENSEFVYGLDMSFGFIRYAAARAPLIPFVCGDAGRLPFKDRTFRAVTVSFGLHDKSPDLRHAMMTEARRVLAPGGKLIAVDFKPPWDARSRIGALFAHAIERLAGGEHYRNGREFLRRGGLSFFLRESGFVEVSRRDIATGAIGMVVARVASVDAGGHCDLSPPV